MMHPDTELKFVSPEIGYGVFARTLIPKGTIVYATDALDIKIRQGDALAQNPLYERFIKRYAVLEHGHYILSWDIGKYVNHCCNPNCLATGYGFEIAIRDIATGEELTDEYGLFNMQEEVEFVCHHANCRRRLRSDDIDVYGSQWDEIIKQTLQSLQQVPQPLFPYLEAEIVAAVTEYLTTGNNYCSVATLKLVEPSPQPTNGVGNYT